VGSAQKQAVAAAHLVRVERIERLQKALPSGNVAVLLRADGGEASVEGCMVRASAAAPPAVSPAHASHLSSPRIGWAVVCTVLYKGEGLLTQYM
jgi:hypothetical protein